jgi:hypothetical protein
MLYYAGVTSADPSAVDGDCATENPWFCCRSDAANDKLWVHRCQLGTEYVGLLVTPLSKCIP